MLAWAVKLDSDGAQLTPRNRTHVFRVDRHIRAQSEMAVNFLRRTSDNFSNRSRSRQSTGLPRSFFKGSPLGPYSRPMPRALRWSYGGGLFLMSEVQGLLEIKDTHRPRVLQ